jgi:hypothetical protein
MYKKAFKLCTPKPIDYYRISEAYTLKGEKKLSYKYLKKAYAGYLDVGFFTNLHKSSIFYQEMEVDSSLKLFMEKQNKIFTTRWKKVRNKATWDTIQYFKTRDQLYRSKMDSLKLMYHYPERLKDFKDRWEQNDSIVGEHLFIYLSKNKFPDVYRYGEPLFTVLLHLTCKAYHKIKPILFQQMIHGYVPVRYYAAMVDRIGCGCDGQGTYLAYPIAQCKVSYSEALQNSLAIGLSTYFRDSYIFPTGNHRFLFAEGDTTFYYK